MNARSNPSSHSPDQVLHAKLMPPRLPASAIHRGDLLRRLDGGLSRKLTLVTAPTGYGKTTLVRQWIADRKICAAWLTLDDTDNDPVRFWTYVLTALRTIDPSLGKPALSALGGSQPVSLQPVLTALINDLVALDRSCVLVLEDYHAIASPEIQDSVSFLIQHLPDSLHVVLISRNLPSLPLGILRARDELVELDAGSLRFTPVETEAFLRETVSRQLPPDLVASLQDRTEGWAAGLRLAVLTLQNRNNKETGAFIESFLGSHRFVADYLIQEVFQNQPQAVQDFLIRTCFLDRLTGSLCDAVIESREWRVENKESRDPLLRSGESSGHGDSNESLLSTLHSLPSQAILEYLDRENLFIVPLEQSRERTWYRYHPLFAESIQTIARPRLGEEGMASIFEKASGWYETHGLYEEAIQAALSAKLYPRALMLIEKFIQIHDLSGIRTLGRWLEGIPEREIILHPEICFAYAQVILYTSPDRFAPATAASLVPYMAAAEKAWSEQNNRSQMGQLMSFRGLLSWWQGDFPKAFGYARQSLDYLQGQEVFWRGNSLLIASQEALNAGRILEAQDTVLEARALLGAAQNKYGVLAAIQMLGEALYGQGELDQAEQLNRQILVEAVGEESMLDDQGIASLALSNIAYERNDLAEAGQLATRALELARQRGNEMLEIQVAVRQACISVAQNHIHQAHELLQSQLAGIQNPAFLREVQEAQARLAIQTGDIQAAMGWQALVSGDIEPWLDVQKERQVFTLARLRIAQGKPKAALEILEGRAAEAAENGRVRSQVTALSLEALAQHAEANVAGAVRPLVEALHIGQAKSFRRLFLDEGRLMRALLQAVLPKVPDRILHLYATTLLHSFDPERTVQPGATVLVEPLSQQELRVLRLLKAGLSNKDIARELVVSTNTVKTHVKNIYRKLDVRSREEAREVARELKMV